MVSLWVNFFLLFHFLYCGYSILFCEIKRNHGVYMQLNSDSKDEWGIWETKMLVLGMGQYRVSILCSAWGSPITSLSRQGRLTTRGMLREATRPIQGCLTLPDDRQRMSLQTTFLESPDPSSLLWSLIPRYLPSLGNSLLNKTKRRTLTFR